MDDFVTRVEHTEFAKRIDKENEIQNTRITALEKAVEGINHITINVERLAISMENMTKELERQGIKLNELESKPAKRWETLVGCIISALVTAAVAYFLTR